MQSYLIEMFRNNFEEPNKTWVFLLPQCRLDDLKQIIEDPKHEFVQMKSVLLGLVGDDDFEVDSVESVVGVVRFSESIDKDQLRARWGVDHIYISNDIVFDKNLRYQILFGNGAMGEFQYVGGAFPPDLGPLDFLFCASKFVEVVGSLTRQ